MKSNLYKSILFFFLLVIFSSIGFSQVLMPISESEKKIIANAEENKLLPIKPNEVAVIGEVKTPLILTKYKSLSVFEAISMVGGLLRTADVNVIILKKDSVNLYLFTVFVNLNLIKLGKHKDLILEEGDIVVVKSQRESLPSFPSSPIPIKEFPIPIKINPKYV